MQVQGKIYLGLGLIFILYALANFLQQPATKTNTTVLPIDQPIKIIAVGDINLGRVTGQKIIAGDINYPFAHIADYLKSFDITFGNLESQLADLDGETQSPTNEYRFAGPPAGADSLVPAGFDVVSLANNHMWDYGKNRLFETLDNLDRVGIKYVGSSKTTENLYQPVITEVKNQKIAWFAVTALLNGYEKMGAKDYVAWADDNRLITAIQQIKPQVNWVIVSMHRGVEYAATPSSTQIEFAHKVIDAGANIVIGHHPHVPQGIEEYIVKSSPPAEKIGETISPPARGGVGGGGSIDRKGIIFYSLGNFAFWQPMEYWTQHSFAVELTLKQDGTFDHTIVPINAGWQPSLTPDDIKDKTMQYIARLSEKLNPTTSTAPGL